MTDMRKYAFDPDILNCAIRAARPSLGEATTVEAYRLMQFTLRDVLEQEFGTKETDRLFSLAGELAGRSFFRRYCGGVTDASSLAGVVQKEFKRQGMGLVRFELVDLDRGLIRLTVDEDLDCSGLPDTQDTVCVYDEGFIKGLLDSFSGEKYRVKEVDCWCTGARSCRFVAERDV
ncbi:4-vinyl reductase [Desulfovibrio sp. OttesenSCG-928-G15]|nr:4-vinyl reductase [Desulfovibrio sp. OttesenSCG-928-G15]